MVITTVVTVAALVVLGAAEKASFGFDVKSLNVPWPLERFDWACGVVLVVLVVIIILVVLVVNVSWRLGRFNWACGVAKVRVDTTVCGAHGGRRFSRYSVMRVSSS